jgi:hypothetical protein
VKIGNFQGLFCENSGHIHNYVLKPNGLLAKGPGWMESRESDSFRGFLEIWPRLKKRNLGLPKG